MTWEKGKGGGLQGGGADLHAVDAGAVAAYHGRVALLEPDRGGGDQIGAPRRRASGTVVGAVLYIGVTDLRPDGDRRGVRQVGSVDQAAAEALQAGRVDLKVLGIRARRGVAGDDVPIIGPVGLEDAGGLVGARGVGVGAAPTHRLNIRGATVAAHEPAGLRATNSFVSHRWGTSDPRLSTEEGEIIALGWRQRAA